MFGKNGSTVLAKMLFPPSSFQWAEAQNLQPTSKQSLCQPSHGKLYSSFLWAEAQRMQPNLKKNKHASQCLAKTAAQSWQKCYSILLSNGQKRRNLQPTFKKSLCQLSHGKHYNYTPLSYGQKRRECSPIWKNKHASQGLAKTPAQAWQKCYSWPSWGKRRNLGAKSS